MPIRNLLLCLEDKAPYLAPAATIAALQELQDTLEDMDAPKLPTDYYDFLLQNNGFIWHGVEIFGTAAISLETRHSIVPALHEIHDSYASSLSEMQNRLLIGRSEDDLYVYDHPSNAYWILDRHGLEEVSTFVSFLDLMRQIIEERQ